MVATIVKSRRMRNILLLLAVLVAAPAIYFAVAGRPTLGGATAAEEGIRKGSRPSVRGS